MAIAMPDGSKTALLSSKSWQTVTTGAPVLMSQIEAVRSFEAVTMLELTVSMALARPSGLTLDLGGHKD